MSVVTSNVSLGMDSHNAHTFEDSEDEAHFGQSNRITIQAEVHHPPFFEESDEEDHLTGQNDGIELVELKPNGALPQTGVHPYSFLPNNLHDQLESSLSGYSISSYNYSDYEHVYEESQCQLVDFNLADNSFVQLYPPKGDAYSVNIDEALDSLDDVLVSADSTEDNMSTTSSYTTSSLLSQSMISLSLSLESDSTSSQFSDATYRLGSSNSGNIETDSSSRTSADKKKREFIRRVERFGFDLQDPCLFPLALPMDGSDIYKGVSTWESINLLADCVLSIWTDNSRQSSNVFPVQNECFHRWHNPVLVSSPKYLCLQPELADRFLLHPDVRLPFRRCVSETDLSQLGIEEVQLNKPRMNLAAQLSHGGDSLYTSNTFRVEEKTKDDEEDENDDRSRSRSSLTMYLAKKVTSFKEAKQRKDRFNLNLTKNMKTEAKRLASKNELENPYKFARKISKLEKRYYLSVASKEFMSLVFKKGATICQDLEEMLDFGQELSQLIADLVCTEFTVDEQGQLIANAIETAFTLHQKQNYQSFKSVMRGLQLPEVYRLRNAWKVVQQKYPLHLRVFIYLAYLMTYKVDQSVVNSITPSLPSLNSFIDILRVRCLSIWDQLECKPHWRIGPGVVSLLAQYQMDESVIEKKVKAKLVGDMETKLRKWQQKGRQVKFPLKRLIHPESRTMANILRKEQKHAKIGRDTISRLKASSLTVESGQIPFSWTLRSLRHLPSQFQMPVIREFNSVYGQLIANIEVYKF